MNSLSEGLPVSLLEYGLNRKPVVTTNVGEIPLIIENNINGFVVPNYNAEEFYQSIVKLIENPALRIKFGDKLEDTILKNNSEAAIITNYINWLKK